MEVRELRARDIKTLAKMLGKLKPESIEALLAATKKGGGGNMMEAGLAIFRLIAADLTDDIYAWLADLIGKTPADLDEMSADIPFAIIKILIERGDFKSFFGSVSRQAEKPNSSPGSTT